MPGDSNSNKEHTTCCVVGGGPAGMMTGFLLARAGIPVTVLEKHGDFFRDFRGDTVHPSTLEIFYELGLLKEFLRVPHQKIRAAGGVIGDFDFTAADFRHVPTHCQFVALMPQWDFLDFVAREARQLPNFRLEMEHEATDILWDRERACGVQVKTPNGAKTLHSDLVIACDGRHSTMRRCASLEVVDAGVPIDVLWFRISRNATDPENVLGRVNYGKALILIDRGDYFQAGLIIRKGSFGQLRRDGLPRLHEILVQISPFLADRVKELKDWEQIKLLTVQINHLPRWHRPGLLCIGDAAHAMSPAGGVGINLAIQDAVAAARILAPALPNRNLTDNLLAAVQRRREFPTRVTQFLQQRAHAGFARVFETQGPFQAPWQLKVALRIPGFQRVLGRIVGVGIRPEHVKKQGDQRLLVRMARGIGVALAVMAWQRRRPAAI